MRNMSKFFKKTVSVILSIFLVFPITNAYNLHTELEKFFGIYNKTNQNLTNTEQTWDNFWYLICLYQRVLHIVRKSDSKSSTIRTKLRPDLVTLAYKLLENNNNNIPKRSFVKEKFWNKKSKDLRIYKFDKTEFLDNTHIEEFLEKFNLQEKYEITEAQRKFIDSIDNYSMPGIIVDTSKLQETKANINLDDYSDSGDMDFSSNSTATRVFRNKTNILRYTEEHVSFTRCFRSSDDEDMYIVMPKNKIIKKRSNNFRENLETAGILTGLVTVFSAGTYIIFKNIKNIYQEIVKDKNNNKSQKSRV